MPFGAFPKVTPQDWFSAKWTRAKGALQLSELDSYWPFEFMENETVGRAGGDGSFFILQDAASSMGVARGEGNLLIQANTNFGNIPTMVSAPRTTEFYAAFRALLVPDADNAGFGLSDPADSSPDSAQKAFVGFDKAIDATKVVGWAVTGVTKTHVIGTATNNASEHDLEIWGDKTLIHFAFDEVEFGSIAVAHITSGPLSLSGLLSGGGASAFQIDKWMIGAPKAA